MANSTHQAVETVNWRVPVSLLGLMEQVGALLFVADSAKGEWTPDASKAAAIADVLAEGDPEIAKALNQQLQDSYREYLRMPASAGQDALRPVP